MTERQQDQRDFRTDVLLRFMDHLKNLEVLGGKSVEAAFSSEPATRDTLQHLDKEAFVNLLQGINGILRGKRSHDWKLDWERVDLVGFAETVLFPPIEKKALLLGELHATMKRMVDAGRPRQDIATLVSSTLVAIHPFGDGNGRTSRLIDEMIAHGTQEGWRGRLKKLLSEDGRELHDTAPSVATTNQLQDLVMEHAGATGITADDKPVDVLWTNRPPSKMEFPKGTDPQHTTLFIDAYKHDGRLAFAAVLNHLQAKGTLHEFLQDFPQHQVINLDTLFPTLTSQDIESILETYGELKANQVRLLMDSIEHPENEDYQIERQSH